MGTERGEQEAAYVAGDRRNPDAQFASIDAKLDAVKAAVDMKAEMLTQQIGFSDRNSAQLVRLIEEKLVGVNDKISSIQKAQEEDRDTFLRSISTIDSRVESLEQFKTKLIGIAIGMSLASGGLAGAIVKYAGN